MDTQDAPQTLAAPPALEFVGAETVGPPLGSELIPHNALVLWEEERADLYRRLFALIAGNKLKLVKVTAGWENRIEILAEAALTDRPAVLRPRFVTREDLVLWAGPHPRRPGLARTLLLRVGNRLELLRVTAHESTAAIEILDSVDAGE